MTMYRYRILVLATFLTLFVAGSTLPSLAQSPTVAAYLQQVAKGWTVDAKKALPDLLLERPDDPGVTFLHASLVEEPAKAVPLYERIVERFPTNEWADDALLRLVLQACSLKDATRANKYFKQMRQLYAKSELLPIAYDAMRMSVGVPPPETTSAPTTPSAQPAQPAQPAPAVAKDKADTVMPFTLVALTTPDKAAATKLAGQYKSKHLKATVAEKWIKGKRNYVVQIGQYASEVDAANDLASVRKVCNCKPVISRRMP